MSLVLDMTMKRCFMACQRWKVNSGQCACINRLKYNTSIQNNKMKTKEEIEERIKVLEILDAEEVDMAVGLDYILEIKALEWVLGISNE